MGEMQRFHIDFFGPDPGGIPGIYGLDFSRGRGGSGVFCFSVSV